MIILSERSLVTIQVYYFIPDYPHLIGRFIWQTQDVKPRYPRIHRFLDHWRREIDAVIKEIVICDSTSNWRHGTFIPL